MTADWLRVQEIFGAAADLPLDQQAAFLRKACGADDALRAEVASLLAADRTPLSRIQRAVVDEAAAVVDSGRIGGGRMIGAYRVLGEIGHGGMGTVYLAERGDHQYRKKVAIKMARYGAEGEFVLQRFRHERQILASLEHPHIARLLDGGETEEGLPYLVMEYIEGLPITRFAADRNLSPHQRLAIFLEVADAVQYAHRLLVIHRDLKPTNILVTEDGQAKLLDFGIAKLLESGTDADAAIMHTSTGMRLLTPDYASPEQVRGQRVTTASDVYSLGAVLYELLTGSQPHGLKDYTAQEIDRAVCETPTDRPSTVAAKKGYSGDYTSEIRADLDLIVLKAMHKDPLRRYASAEHLAEDIRRYLGGLPIEARGDSKAYRARLFLKRHRFAATGALVLLMSLVGGITATTWQWARARTEMRRADLRFRQVRHLANRFLFDFDGRVQKLEGATPIREMVVRTAKEYLSDLSQDGGASQELRGELAVAYKRLADIEGSPRSASLGRSEDALRSYSRSLEIGRTLFAEGWRDPAVLENLSESARLLGLLERRLRGGTGAESYLARLKESIEFAEELRRQRDDVVSLRLLASVYREMGEYHADADQPTLAEQMYLKALPVYRELRQKAPGLRSERGVLMITQLLGDTRVMRGDLESGRKNYEETLAGWRTLIHSAEAGSSETRSMMDAHLSVCAVLGDPAIPNFAAFAEAGAICAEAVAIADHLAASDPVNRTAKLDLAYAESQFGRVLRAQKSGASVAHSRRAVALSSEVWSGASGDRVYLRHVLRYRTDLARALTAAGKNAEARTEFERVLRDAAPVRDSSASFLLIAAEAQREVGLLEHSVGNAEVGKTAVLQALQSIEQYYQRHADSIEVIDDWSLFYEAATRVTGNLSYKARARRLWIEWPKRGASSFFDRRRLRDVDGLQVG